MNDRYIDAYVCVSADDPPWRLTRLYGEPRTEDHHFISSLLSDLHHLVKMSCVVTKAENEAIWGFKHFS